MVNRYSTSGIYSNNKKLYRLLTHSFESGTTVEVEIRKSFIQQSYSNIESKSKKEK